MRGSVLLAGLLGVVVSGCIYTGPAPSSDATITIDNASSYVLTEVRVTHVRSSSWGPNLLGGDVLYPNEQITVRVACGTWDVLVSDEYARDCVIAAVYLCGSDQVWTIDDRTLRSCGF
jgi:hypothetical protein